MNAPNVDATVNQIETLLDRLGEIDSASRALAEAIVRNLMQLYGAGLEQIFDLLQREADPSLSTRLVDHRLIGSLLLLHGIHPADAETRVRQALHRVERGLDRQQLVLTGIVNNVAHIRVQLNGAHSAPPNLAAAIERAIAEAAPDLDGVHLEGLPKIEPSLVQIVPAIAS